MHVGVTCSILRQAYDVGSAGNNIAAAGANIQHPVPWLQLQSLKAGGVHVGGRHIEVQLIQAHWRVCERFITVCLSKEVVPGA